MKKGFTLTEIVIIFATIITFIAAAIAVPIYISNSQKKIYVLSLKKAYVQFNLVLQNIAEDRNCSDDLQCAGIFDKGTTDETLGDTLVKYFKIKKNCRTSKNEGCFPVKTNEFYDGKSSSYYDLDDWDGYRFITKDGMAYYVWNYALDCSENFSTESTGDLKETCGEIYVDINGPKNGPNTMGRDTFNLWIANGKGATIYPMGASDTKWTDEDWRWKNPSTGGIQRCYPAEKTGWPCAGRIIEENWQMNY